MHCLFLTLAFPHGSVLSLISYAFNLYHMFPGWIQKPLMKLYIESCSELSEAPNMKLLKKLYNKTMEVGSI